MSEELLTSPKYTWRVIIGGSADLGLAVYYERPPNWFWRKMQYLILGFKWEKL